MSRYDIDRQPGWIACVCAFLFICVPAFIIWPVSPVVLVVIGVVFFTCVLPIWLLTDGADLWQRRRARRRRSAAAARSRG